MCWIIHVSQLSVHPLRTIIRIIESKQYFCIVKKSWPLLNEINNTGYSKPSESRIYIGWRSLCRV